MESGGPKGPSRWPKATSPPQELEVGGRKPPYLLVIQYYRAQFEISQVLYGFLVLFKHILKINLTGFTVCLYVCVSGWDLPTHSIEEKQINSLVYTGQWDQTEPALF